MPRIPLEDLLDLAAQATGLYCHLLLASTLVGGIGAMSLCGSFHPQFTVSLRGWEMDPGGCAAAANPVCTGVCVSSPSLPLPVPAHLDANGDSGPLGPE